MIYFDICLLYDIIYTFNQNNSYKVIHADWPQIVKSKKDENGNEIGEENKIPGLSAGYATNEAIEAFKKGSKVTKKFNKI